MIITARPVVTIIEKNPPPLGSLMSTWGPWTKKNKLWKI